MRSQYRSGGLSPPSRLRILADILHGPTNASCLYRFKLLSVGAYAIFLFSFCGALGTTASIDPRLEAPEGLGNLDAVYIIGMPQCEDRWQHANAWTAERGIEPTRIYATRFDQINLRQPPIPILGVQENESVTAGQVACTFSHIRAWRHAFAHNHSTIMILEDDARPSDYLLNRIPNVISEANKGSRIQKGIRWHFIYLRFQPTLRDTNRSNRNWYGQVLVAGPGWGTAAYILSNAGIRFLLTRVTTYSHPLDVQIERLQMGLDNQGARFVALHACDVNTRGEPKPGCPENIAELSQADRGNCFFSASQAGESLLGGDFPGAKKSRQLHGNTGRNASRISIRKLGGPVF